MNVVIDFSKYLAIQSYDSSDFQYLLKSAVYCLIEFLKNAVSLNQQ